MKRKIIVFMLSLLLVVTCISGALAETLAPTERRPLVEFCELYEKRVFEFNDLYGENTGGISTIILGLPAQQNDSGYSISTSGGQLYVNESDLTIQELFTPIMDLDADEQKGHNTVISALISLSALEMDDNEAWQIEMMHKIDESQPENVIMKYLEGEYTNIIHPALSSNVDKLDAGEEVLVYRGNYDYYAKYLKYGDGGKIYLYARARE